MQKKANNLLSVLFLFLLNSCSHVTTQANLTDLPEQFQSTKIGQSFKSVRALLGSPASTHNENTRGVNLEVLEYTRDFPSYHTTYVIVGDPNNDRVVAKLIEPTDEDPQVNLDHWLATDAKKLGWNLKFGRDCAQGTRESYMSDEKSGVIVYYRPVNRKIEQIVHKDSEGFRESIASAKACGMPDP